ncbi:hypothetical protein AKO1_014121 [Acrasis kona]|uniref:Myb-like domain-containing protein n=1 Tax=Acrasis kona TaxID=1008807 RepID=A0AAW2YZI4_9EUKA
MKVPAKFSFKTQQTGRSINPEDTIHDLKVSGAELKTLVEDKFDFCWAKIAEHLDVDPFVCRNHYIKQIENSKQHQEHAITLAKVDESYFDSPISASAYEAAFLSLYEKNEIPSPSPIKSSVSDSMFNSIITRVGSESYLFSQDD